MCVRFWLNALLWWRPALQQMRHCRETTRYEANWGSAICTGTGLLCLCQLLQELSNQRMSAIVLRNGLRTLRPHSLQNRCIFAICAAIQQSCHHTLHMYLKNTLISPSRQYRASTWSKRTMFESCDAWSSAFRFSISISNVYLCFAQSPNLARI